MTSEQPVTPKPTDQFFRACHLCNGNGWLGHGDACTAPAARSLHVEEVGLLAGQVEKLVELKNLVSMAGFTLGILRKIAESEGFHFHAVLDADDHQDVMEAIMRRIDQHGGEVVLPEGGSDLYGLVLGEICRDWLEAHS